MPYDGYLQLVEQAEMLEDIQDFDAIHEAIHNGTEELLPASVVFDLAGEENPLKVWREYRGFTQQQLAEEAGTSVPFLSQIKTGKRKASVGVLVKIASILPVLYPVAGIEPQARRVFAVLPARISRPDPRRNPSPPKSNSRKGRNGAHPASPFWSACARNPPGHGRWS